MRNPLWTVAWPWVVFATATANASMAMQRHREGSFGTEGAIETIIFAALATISLFGLVRLVRDSDKYPRTTAFQAAIFAITIPILALTNPDANTRIFVYIAGFVVAILKMILVSSKRSSEGERMPRGRTFRI